LVKDGTIADIWSFGPVTEVGPYEAVSSFVFGSDSSKTSTMNYMQPDGSYYGRNANVHYRMVAITRAQYDAIKVRMDYFSAHPYTAYTSVDTCASVTAMVVAWAHVDLPVPGTSNVNMLWKTREMVTPNSLIRDWEMNSIAKGNNFAVGWGLKP